MIPRAKNYHDMSTTAHCSDEENTVKYISHVQLWEICISYQGTEIIIDQQ